MTAETDIPSSSDAPPLGRRARKAQAVRRALLDAGVRLFAERPLASVSVLDITEAADVAKGVFYLHFDNRDAYLLALYRDQQEALLGLMQADTRADGVTRPFVERAIRAYVRFARDHRNSAIFWWRFAGMLPNEVGAPDHLREARDAYFARLTCLIEPGARITAAAIQRSTRIDALAWGLIGQALQRGDAPPTENALRTVLAATLPPRPTTKEDPARLR